MLLSGRLGVVKLILRMHALLMLLQLTGAVTFGPRPKKLRRSHSNISSVGDGQSEASDTAELFARKYRELYVNHITLQKFNKLRIDPSSLLCDANKF